MAANNQHGVILFRFGKETVNAVRVFPQRLVALQELLRDCIVFEGLNRAGVKRGFATIGRCNGNIAVLNELLVWMREFGLCSGMQSVVNIAACQRVLDMEGMT